MSSTLDTIRKLMRLANDEAATEGEVQAALGRVAHLAAQHSISDVEIERAVRADGTEGVRMRVDHRDMVEECVFSKGQLFRWDKWLARACCIASNTKHYLGWDRASGRPGIIAYGLPEDVAVCRELLTFARSAMTRCSRSWARDERSSGRTFVQGNHPEVRTYKDGFCMGLIEAARRTQEELRRGEERTQVQVGGEAGTALVAVSGIVEAKQRALAAKRQSLCLRRGRSLGGIVGGSSNAYDDGKQAGRSTNLGRRAVK